MRTGLLLAFAIAALGCQSSYYQPCAADRDCDDDQQCARPGGLIVDPPPEPFCTGACATSADCAERFGPYSYCGLVGVCFQGCAGDVDCPNGSVCTSEGFCAHAMEAP